MNVQQLYTQCLAQGAYYIESAGEAAIIDPLREVQPYLDLAEQRQVKIKYIFETHFHADFVSGHQDLAKKTGAPIVYGPTDTQTGFDRIHGQDGQVFPLGDVSLTLLHTPGHTLESSCYLLKDETGKPSAIFTGDTLFIGDVGRPDLAQKVVAELTQEKLAAMLFYSLRNKIMPLPDDIIVYPAHGAGSACGKNMSKETSDTLGNQKRTNYALRADMTEEEFVREVLTGLVAPPAYFPENVALNIQGYDAIDEVMQRGVKPLDIEAFQQLRSQEDVLVLDTRHPDEFIQGFIPGSVNIGLQGTFAVWVGTLIQDIRQKMILVTQPGTEQEVVTRLARVGYDQALGFLNGGILTWKQNGLPLDSIPSVTVTEFAAMEKKDPDIHILDVRKTSEYASEHVVGAQHVPLDFVHSRLHEVNNAEPIYVHCAGGYRSVIFCSIMKKNGYQNLINVAGGFNAIKGSGAFSVTEYVCPTTLL